MGLSDSAPKEWPGWLRFTLTGLAGLAGGAATVLLSFSDVKHDAANALSEVRGIEPRVRALESTSASNGAEVKQLQRTLEIVGQDVKELLRRSK